MSKFRYEDDIPAELLPVVERIFAPLEVLLPQWCDHVFIHAEHANDTNEDVNAQINTYYDYRWASIRLQPSWFAQSDAAKSEDAAHELIHILRAPMDDWARTIIGELVPADDAPKFHKMLMEEVRARGEMVTQDTMIIMRTLMQEKAGRTKERLGDKANKTMFKAWELMDASKGKERHKRA